MADADLQRLRNRLNTLVLFLPGQWFGIMAFFWLRYVPAFRPFAFQATAPHPAILAFGVALFLAPFFLPQGWFRPRWFERGAFYPRLGVRLFRYLAPDGDLIQRRLRRVQPSYRVVSNRAALQEHIRATYSNERWHLAFLLLGLFTQAVAAASGQWGWFVFLTLSNTAFNLYPVLHQRYKRARLRRGSAPALARVGSPGGGP
jgi:hypothetical protein